MVFSLNSFQLWMGVHPNGPSKLVSDGKLLSEKIAESKSFLGDHEGGSLQFLFKVLSVNKALSIQSHPDKAGSFILIVFKNLIIWELKAFCSLFHQQYQPTFYVE